MGKKKKRKKIEKREESKETETYKGDDDNIWDSGLNIIKGQDIHILVSEEISRLCKALEQRVDTEFMLYAKADFRTFPTITIQDIFFPEQEASYAYVKSLEKKPDEFNVVIHRHPHGNTQFSATDDEFLNNNSLISMLFTNGEFATATINIKINGTSFVQVETENIESEENYINVEPFLKKIRNVTQNTQPQQTWNKWNNKWNKWNGNSYNSYYY